jgi:hypothetical protein
LPTLVELEPLPIDAADLPSDLIMRLWTLIDTLGVVPNDAKLLAGTKTLHHLLPDLVPPMDREWTGTFFGLHGPEWRGVGQRRTFVRTYGTLRGIAQEVDLRRHVTGDRWRTSVTKVLDNAVIGYCILEMSPHASAEADGGSDAHSRIDPSAGRSRRWVSPRRESWTQMATMLSVGWKPRMNGTTAISSPGLVSFRAWVVTRIPCCEAGRVSGH